MRILVTGGAGFIGSNLVERLLKEDRITLVRVLDNLSTGFRKNLEEFVGHPKFEIVYGDIRDYQVCLEATKGIDRISHQAALGSVPRSIKDPLMTNAVNIGGFLNIFTAAKENGVTRIVYAASSSTYGDSTNLPKIEHTIGNPLSPYAVTKYVNELYSKVYSDLYGIEFIGLRYFNVFGPKQDPFGGYAAVIPLFMKAAYENKSPIINGDGTYSRDFTFIDNVVQANILSLYTTEKTAINQIYNIACGEQTTLNQLWMHIKSIAGCETDAKYGAGREGDIPHSLANIEKVKSKLDYEVKVKIEAGIAKSYDWYKNNI